MMIAEKRPIQRKSLHAAVVEELREMIISGKLKSGERLKEGTLCDLFDISRTPLREALKVLETEGLVTLRPNQGARVVEVSATEITELFEVVANLERIAIELAIERMDDRQISQLQRMHERMLRFHQQGRRRDCFQTDNKIHRLIVTLANNSILNSTHESLNLRSRRGRYQALFSQARWDESMDEHEHIMTAIGQRDAFTASELMRAHVLQTGVVVREASHSIRKLNQSEARLASR